MILKLSDLYKICETNADGTADNGVNASSSTDTAKSNVDKGSDTAVKTVKAFSEIGRILQQESPLLELKVLVININPGNNQEFLDQCPTLREYMKYVECVRSYCGNMDLKEAVQRAVDECIKDGILADFLRKNKAEVIAMSIFEYDEKEVLDYLREEERAIGRIEGKEEGRAEGKEEEAQRYGRLILHLTNEGKSNLIVKIAADDALRERLYKEYEL